MSSKTEYAATIVSIVPFVIEEDKPGIYPGHFVIPASVDESPQFLHVGESIYHVEVDEDRTVTVKCPPTEMARSLVEDYVKATLAYDERLEAQPGIFWMFGKISKMDLMNNNDLLERLETAKRQQYNWFKRLIEMADDDWEKTRQHRSISDTQRYAAKALKQDRPWIVSLDSIAKQVVDNSASCPVCKSRISTEAIVCPQCKAILKLEEHKKFQFAS